MENIFKNNIICWADIVSQKEKDKIKKCQHSWYATGGEAWCGIYKGKHFRCSKCMAEKYINSGKIYS